MNKTVLCLAVALSCTTATAAIKELRVWHNAVPYGSVYAPDSDLCRDGAETPEGASIDISCGPPDVTVR